LSTHLLSGAGHDAVEQRVLDFRCKLLCAGQCAVEHRHHGRWEAGVETIAFSPTATFNVAGADAFEIQLIGNLTPNVVGATPGSVVTFAWLQDGNGGPTVSFGSPFDLPGPAQPDPTPFAISMQSFLCLSDSLLRPLIAMTVSPD
jgi:hypothetical protein